MAECSGLLNRRIARYRGFESLPLRFLHLTAAPISLLNPYSALFLHLFFGHTMQAMNNMRLAISKPVQNYWISKVEKKPVAVVTNQPKIFTLMAASPVGASPTVFKHTIN